MVIELNNNETEFKFRLVRKTNFKGEKAIEYSIKSNSIEELKEREKELLEYLNGG